MVIRPDVLPNEAGAAREARPECLPAGGGRKARSGDRGRREGSPVG